MHTTMKRSRPVVESQSASPVEATFALSTLGLALRQMLQTARGSNATIADFLLRNPVRATAWGIEELASQTQTSTATLSRFARTLGFGGYAALRSAIADALQAALQPVFHPVEKLKGALGRPDLAAGNRQPVIAESLQASLDNLRATVAGLDTARLTSVATQLLEAQTVYTMGFGLSAHLAALLALDLQPFCRQVVNVVEFGGTEVAAGRLMNIGASDTLVAISFPRYANDVVTLARYARDRGAKVVVITDSMASPLVPPAHSIFLAPALHPVMSSSSAAAVVVIEALVTSLMVSGHVHVRQAEKLTEAISAYLYDEKSAARIGPRRSRASVKPRSRR